MLAGTSTDVTFTFGSSSFDLEMQSHIAADSRYYDSAEYHTAFLPSVADQPLDHWSSAAGLQPSSTVTNHLDDIGVASPTETASEPSGPVRKTRTTRRPRKPRRKASEEPRDTLARRHVCEVCAPAGKKRFARPSALSLHMVRSNALFPDLKNAKFLSLS